MFGKANKNWHAAAYDNKSFRIVPRGSKFFSTKIHLIKCQNTYMIKSASMPRNKLDEITQFSHAVVRICCSVVYYLVLGAS